MNDPSFESKRMMYEALRKEIDDFLKEIGTLVTTSILASGAAWGWIFVNQDKIPPAGKSLLFVPAVVVFLAGMRAHALREGTVRVAGHLARLERALGFDEQLGWHIRWENELPTSKFLGWRTVLPSLGTNPLAPGLYIFWFIILLLNLIPAILLYKS